MRDQSPLLSVPLAKRPGFYLRGIGVVLAFTSSWLWLGHEIQSALGNQGALYDGLFRPLTAVFVWIVVLWISIKWMDFYRYTQSALESAQRQRYSSLLFLLPCITMPIVIVWGLGPMLQVLGLGLGFCFVNCLVRTRFEAV